MEHIQRSGELAGAVAPGALVTGSDYVVTEHKTLTVRHLTVSKQGIGDVYLQEVSAAGVVQYSLPIHFPAAGIVAFENLHFRVRSQNTARVFVNDGAGPASQTECFWSGAEE